ncbi:hypothetical protein OAG1_14100 [Agarivorans sp. OAG1]|uniref:Uncharacterized protein n=1 Tax=Agarivorans albus MKT 106 TaxID=1331007 RepID=R9PTG6_AGAAL|nr:hypothetical protein [Agarivorans albus]BEU02610.1 hypothetical protein OAG1_14100 [Agarivorans sp. OAG1]GAD02386.1 hypothetical protein AALB_2466 [Agarivorans albus MKT 106]
MVEFKRTKLGVCYLLFWSLMLLLLMTVGKDFLPWKWGYDAMKIEGRFVFFELDGSFLATRELLYFLGRESAVLSTATIGFLWLLVISKYVVTLKDLLVVSLFTLPSMLLNVIWPAKETIVMALCLLVFYSTYFSRKAFIFSVVVLYVSYALQVRSYYFLILGVFLAGYVMQYFSDKGFPMRNSLNRTAFKLASFKPAWYFLAFFVCLAFLLPDAFYQMSQGQRDISNNYAKLEGSFNVTAFDNLVDVARGLPFIINFGWALLQLSLPLIFAQGLNQLLLLLFSVGVLMICGKMIKRKQGDLLLTLFCSHMFVLLLFEPDQGSYFRHILSAAIYLLPAYSLIFGSSRQGVLDD